MTYIPRLRRPITKSTKSNRVRFSDTRRSPKRHRTILRAHISDTEKQRRRQDALDYLRRQNTQTNRGSNRIRRPERKTYELLGERPISHISRPDSLTTSDILRNVKRKAQSQSPLVRREYGKNDEEQQHRGLLQSLSSVGSKLLGSVLFNEKSEDRKLREETRRKEARNVRRQVNVQQRRQMMEDERLEQMINEKRQTLDSLQRQINKERIGRDIKGREVGKPAIETKINALEDMIREMKDNGTKDEVMGELSSIKRELSSISRREETNNVKFEARMEQMQLESELNAKMYKKMMKELEEKRQEVAEEKDKLIGMLKKEVGRKRRLDSEEGNSRKKQRLERIDSGEDESDDGASIRRKLEAITRRMKSMERDVSSNRDEAERLRSEM